jgi:hypothetical protein
VRLPHFGTRLISFEDRFEAIELPVGNHDSIADTKFNLGYFDNAVSPASLNLSNYLWWNGYAS